MGEIHIIARTIVSIVIMLISALVGIFVELAMNGAETFGIMSAIIAGFACTIHAIECKKRN